MKIGFDSKRAFTNISGLGNYSRSTIDLLTGFYPANDYFLYTPSKSEKISYNPSGKVKITEPKSFTEKSLKSYWRSFKLSKYIKNDKLDIYHGLSNELPHNAHKTGAKTIVTVHDLIFLRYPEYFKKIDRQIYKKKFGYSCRIADKVIATSEQTKTDIVNFLSIDEKKIETVYQGCNPIYYIESSNIERIEITQKYKLPAQYILNVGTIEKRKNALFIVKTLHEKNIDIPLVIVGGQTPYQDLIEQYVAENKLENKVIILNNVSFEDLPTIYQMAELFIYPSFFEGFGIPIIEALNSKIPVITTKGGCFSETGGMQTTYVNPENKEELSEAILKILNDKEKRKKIIKEGLIFAERFKEKFIAQNLLSVYI